MNVEERRLTDGLIDDVTGLWRLVRAASYPVHHAGVTPQQFWLLHYLEQHCPLSVGGLAIALGITSSSATSACKRLEQAGLVTRTRQVSDERVVEIDLTAEGRAQLVAIRQRQRDAVGRLLAVLDTREQVVLERLLGRVLDAGRAQLGGEACRHAGRHHAAEVDTAGPRSQGERADSAGPRRHVEEATTAGVRRRLALSRRFSDALELGGEGGDR